MATLPIDLIAQKWYNKDTIERTKKERKKMRYYYFNVSYKRNEVYQAILVRAFTAQHAKRFFAEYKPDAEICGVTEVTDISEDMRKGKPIITAE